MSEKIERQLYVSSLHEECNTSGEVVRADVHLSQKEFDLYPKEGVTVRITFKASIEDIALLHRRFKVTLEPA